MTMMSAVNQNLDITNSWSFKGADHNTNFLCVVLKGRDF